jgi:hypothetical protein
MPRPLRQVSLLANVFNHGCMGWEPVLEPWTVTAQLESALPVQQSSSGSQAAHHKLGLEAKEMLDITASLTGADAAALTLSIVLGALLKRWGPACFVLLLC